VDLKTLGIRTLVHSGFPRLLHRTFYPDRVAILMYHGVVREPLDVDDWCFLNEEDFRQQIQYLKDHFEVVTLAEVVARLRRGEVRRPTAAITFDDGYQNNYDVAFPILREAALPATIFLSTGLVGTAQTVWFCHLIRALAETTLPRLEWNGFRIDLNGAAARARACARLQASLKDLPHARLIEELHGILKALDEETDRPAEAGSPFRILDAASIRAMADSGLIDFGAHTQSHVILAHLPPEEQRVEIERSVAEVARLTGRPCRFFAYPNGLRKDFDAASEEILRSLAIEAAVTTISGANNQRTPPLELRRYGIGSHLPLAQFELLIHHATTQLRRMVSWDDTAPPYAS